MHQALNIGESTLMLNDHMMPEMPLSAPNRAYVYVDDVDAVCKKAQEAGVRT
jgi:uncharacterized glyoxalase superfamily protein PhnB